MAKEREPFQRMKKGKSLLSQEKQLPSRTERDAAKEVDGRRVAASGATPWQKEDIRTRRFLIQHKECLEQASHSVRFDSLEDLRKNAIDEGKDPIYWIATAKRDYYVVDKELFETLVLLSELP